MQGWEDARIRGCKIFYGADGRNFKSSRFTPFQAKAYRLLGFVKDHVDNEEDTDVTVTDFVAKRKKNISSTLLDLDSASNLEGSFSFLNCKSRKHKNQTSEYAEVTSSSIVRSKRSTACTLPARFRDLATSASVPKFVTGKKPRKRQTNVSQSATEGQEQINQKRQV